MENVAFKKMLDDVQEKIAAIDFLIQLEENPKRKSNLFLRRNNLLKLGELYYNFNY